VDNSPCSAPSASRPTASLHSFPTPRPGPGPSTSLSYGHGLVARFPDPVSNPPPVVRPRWLPCASFLPLHCASASSAALAWPPSRVVDEDVDLLQHGQRHQQAHCLHSFMHETPRCALLLRLHVPLRQPRAPDSAQLQPPHATLVCSCLLPPSPLPLPDRPASSRSLIEISSRSDPGSDDPRRQLTHFRLQIGPS
jgi:hypothetical protein